MFTNKQWLWVGVIVMISGALMFTLGHYQGRVSLVVAAKEKVVESTDDLARKLLEKFNKGDE